MSLLREAKIPAYLALLSAGASDDVRESLPGFGAFNHAIVYVPGTPEYWIDATAEHARASDLPSIDQGRLALIISDDTRSLKKTPVRSAEQNTSVYKLKVTMAEYGAAKASFHIQTSGSFDEKSRALITSDEKERSNTLAKTVNAVFGSDQFSDLVYSDAKYLGTPFELSMSVPRVSWGLTDFHKSTLWIPRAPIREWLPSVLSAEFGHKDGAEKIRTEDIELPEAFTREWDYEIVPPDGYSLAELPANEELKLGPAVLSCTYKKTDSGTMLATVRFQIPNRRFPADRGRELESKLEEFEKGRAIAVTFNSSAEMLLSQGKTKEAIAEYRRLVNLHPKEALHRVALSGAFLQAGLGESARAEARAAISLEPASSIAWGAVGDSLRDDLFGRQYKPGFDRQGAIQAYEKALSLDVSNSVALVNEAILYEFDDRGDVTTSAESLDQSIGLFRSAEKLTQKPGGTDDNFLRALFYAKQYPEVVKQATAIGRDSSPLVLAAISLSENSNHAIEYARNHTTNEQARSAALSEASTWLTWQRHYKEAAELAQAKADVISDSSAAVRLEAMRRTKPYQQTLFPDGDPRSAIQQLYLTIYGKSQNKQVLDLFSNIVLTNQDHAKLEADLIRRIGRGSLPKGFEGFSNDVVLDWLLSNFHYVVNGDDQTGYRIRVDREGGERHTGFIVREKGEWKFVEFGHSVAPAGLVALEAIHQGNLAKALQWINWGRDETSVSVDDDPLSGPVFARIWSKGHDANRDEAEIVATVMVAGSWWSDSVIARLTAELDTSKSQEMQSRLRQALCSAFAAVQDWARLAQCSEPLLERQSKSATAFNYVARSYIHLHRWEELNKISQKRLSRDPEDRAALRTLARAAIERGNFAEARAKLKKVIDLPNVSPTDLNSYAWLAMYEDRVDPDAVVAAQRANHLTNGRNYAILHTLACLLAADGNVREARNIC